LVVTAGAERVGDELADRTGVLSLGEQIGGDPVGPGDRETGRVIQLPSETSPRWRRTSLRRVCLRAGRVNSCTSAGR
jgi:hypothetical protein